MRAQGVAQAIKKLQYVPSPSVQPGKHPISVHVPQLPLEQKSEHPFPQIMGADAAFAGIALPIASTRTAKIELIRLRIRPIATSE
jgi:hypothetical protein